MLYYFKHLFFSKVVEHAKEKVSNETLPEEAQILDLVDKNFISDILNIFKELKDTTPKELNKSMRIMFSPYRKYQQKDISIVKAQIEILALKIIIIKIKNSLKGYQYHR